MAYVFPLKCPVTSKNDETKHRKMRISLAMGSGLIGSGLLEQNPLSLGRGKILYSTTSSTQTIGPDANSGFVAVLRAGS